MHKYRNNANNSIARIIDVLCLIKLHSETSRLWALTMIKSIKIVAKINLQNKTPVCKLEGRVRWLDSTVLVLYKHKNELCNLMTVILYYLSICSNIRVDQFQLHVLRVVKFIAHENNVFSILWWSFSKFPQIYMSGYVYRRI